MQHSRIEIEQNIHTAIKQINPNISINTKYTKIFHDRFWIVDSKKGVFVGTSLNGIGRRYAVIDWLQEDDAKEITQRYSQLP